MQILPAMPLRNGVLFPFQLMPLTVGRPRSIATIQVALGAEDKKLVIVSQKNPDESDPPFEQLYEVGTIAAIKRMHRVGDVVQLLVQGEARVRLCRAVNTEPSLQVEVELLPEPADTSTEVEALYGEVDKLTTRALELLQLEADAAVRVMLHNVDVPIHYVYLVASIFSLGLEREQAILSSNSVLAALRLTHDWLTHEVQVLELRNKIASQAQSEMTRQQREYVLRQQLQEIQKELGEEGPAEGDVAELHRRMSESAVPEHVRVEMEKELTRLKRMSPAAADYQVIRTYLDLALEMPWTKKTDDVFNLRQARQILDEDHFDLQDVKDRIVEHLAVMKTNPAAKAPILCFVGPPGVGKTSVGQSIARAMGRKFERMSLGGLHDEAELRGHRRTYVGAMPGRIIQAIRRAGVCNPLLMLDEVDKLGQDFRGDPASALMEILDPAQNFEFHDNYLDLPFDLSQVFFITTANTLDNIPRPLLDRMEVLRLPGYTDDEKHAIARRYLIPRQLAQAGMPADRLIFPDDTLAYIIRSYTREAGVRELERMIGRIVRKTTARVAESLEPTPAGAPAIASESPASPPAVPTAAAGESRPQEVPAGAAPAPPQEGEMPVARPRISLAEIPVTTVQVDDLADLLGPERFLPEKARGKLRPGIAAGLAWTEAGGEVLYVEAVLLPKGKGLAMTGQLGRVMKESAQAARSYIRSRAVALGLDPSKIHHSAVHIHVPAGAVPKDGPSAGIAMATALVSLYSGRATRSDTAMTGEITLSGLVMPVGGIKEKVLAAHRAGLRRIVLPKDNEKDLRELPEKVREEIEFVCAQRIEDALQAVIPGLSTSSQESEAEQESQVADVSAT